MPARCFRVGRLRRGETPVPDTWSPPRKGYRTRLTPRRAIFFIMMKLKSAKASWLAKTTALLALSCLVVSLAGCERDKAAEQALAPSEARPVGERNYGPIEPVVLELPEEVTEALDGSDIDGNPIDKAYIYFKTFALVVYRDSFGVKKYIDDISAALGELAQDEKFKNAADVWAIQMQKRGTSSFVTIAVNPEQARIYSDSGNIETFLREADYLMVSDRIIPPDKRIGLYRGKIELGDLSAKGEND